MKLLDYKLDVSEKPFNTKMSFVPLIKHMESYDKNNEGNNYYSDLLQRIKKNPEFQESFDDVKILDKHRELVKDLFSVVYPPVNNDHTVGSIYIPFSEENFFSTNAYDSLLERTEGLENFFNFNEEKSFLIGSILQIYTIIFFKYYKSKYFVSKPIIFKLNDKKKGLDKYYKMLVNPKFCDIVNKGELKKLSQKEILHLINNSHDLNLWLKTLPLDNFEFQGFICLDFVNVTDEQIISSLKSELLKKESLILPDKFAKLEKDLRTLLRLPDIKVGIAGISTDHKSLKKHNRIWNSIIPMEECDCSAEDFCSSIYHKVISSKNEEIFKLEDITEATFFEKKIIELGYSCIAIIPLCVEDEIIGVLEIASPEKNKLNYLLLKKLYEVIPIFSIAVKRVSDEITNTIQAKIKEEFTAIHPTVEWKFIDVAVTIMENEKNGNNIDIEPVVFNDVYPLFGASDIRNSSLERNKAIQRDLLTQLKNALNVIEEAFEYKGLPVFDQLKYKLLSYVEMIKLSLQSGDEVNILAFLKDEVEPVFKLLSSGPVKLKTAISNYNKAIDDELGIVYKKRKEFEESLTHINDSIGSLLEKEESEAQKMFPHYFEKYRTDGVEYNLYIGSSLVRDQEFDLLYLRNLRLWQMLVMCEITRLAEKIKPELKLQLETAQLILVHGTPLAISFRNDEKVFDVDGAYNIRYEIIKKRIDKARIKNTKERITRPGSIAIIYTQSEELNEYKKYIEYLQAKNYLKEGFETYELEDLQGVYGLKAIRVDVVSEINNIQKNPAEELIEIAKGMNKS